jgi:hypothetical protein
MNQEEVKCDIKKDFLRHIQQEKQRMSLTDIKDAVLRLSTKTIRENIYRNLTISNRERRQNAKDKEEIKQIFQEEQQLERDIEAQAEQALNELVQEGVKI